MPDRETDRMTMLRIGEIVEAYGGDPRRWPMAERSAAERLIAESDDARRLHADALALDTLLDQSIAPVPSPELLAQVLADADTAGRRGVFAGFWPFDSVWTPVSALALAAMAGIAIGGIAPEVVLPGWGNGHLVGEIESFALGFDLAEEPGT